MTDQHDWTTAEIIGAYRGQAVIAGAFRCVVVYLLATLVHLTAVRDAGYVGSVDALFDALATIRRMTVARPTAYGRLRRTSQLDTLSPLRARLSTALGIAPMR